MPLGILGGPRHVRLRAAALLGIACLQVALVVHASSSQLPLVREEVTLRGYEATSLALKWADHSLIDHERA